MCSKKGQVGGKKSSLNVIKAAVQGEMERKNNNIVFMCVCFYNLFILYHCFVKLGGGVDDALV